MSPVFERGEIILIGAVILYLVATVVIGLLAARRVTNSQEYMVAGRSLPLYMVIATTFATWFGSETVLGTSSTFIKDGLAGIVTDPFGASLCLVLMGAFFAIRLYRMNLLTIGDFYKRRYGSKVETLTSIMIVLSYLGWVAAQLTALGLIANILSQGLISREMGMVIGGVIVIIYTMFGGMWSVALTDFLQMSIIVIGMLYIAAVVTGLVPGGAEAVVEHASVNHKLVLLTEYTPASLLGFLGAIMTMGLGSIPQQDVFQRVMSADTARNARRGAIWGGIAYLLFAFIPIYIAYTAFIIDAPLVSSQLGTGGDSQLVLPTLIMEHTPLAAQILFFGALLSAILSTASGTLLAPSTLVARNLIEQLIPPKDDQQQLRLVRLVVVVFGVCVLLFARYKSDLSIFQMVENAYKVTLCGAFVPLVFGLYWRKANTTGALWSIGLGVGVWIGAELLGAHYAVLDDQSGWAILGLATFEEVCPPQLAGFVAAVIGMLVGSRLGTKRAHQQLAELNEER